VEHVEKKEEGGPIDADKDPIKDVRQTPLNLPAAFEWFDCNVDDEAEVRIDQSGGWCMLTAY
jgi:hypothetical protein